MPIKAKSARPPVVEEKFSPRARLLDAGTKAFITVGFGNARLTQIAIDAGVSRSALYGNFSSKEELLVAINEQLHEEGFALAKAMLMQEGSAAEVLRSWLVAAANLTERYRNLTRILHQDEAQPSLLIDREASLKMIRSTQKWIRGLLKRGIDDGDFRADLNINSATQALQNFHYLLSKQSAEHYPIIDMTSHEGVACVDFLIHSLSSPISSRRKSTAKRK